MPENIEQNNIFAMKRKKFTYDWGKPVQFDGSNTLIKQGIPSVGIAPENIKKDEYYRTKYAS